MAKAAGTDLYERDFYAWTQREAARLRALAGDNRFDVDNVAEEIADLGRGEKHAFESHLMRALQNLVQAATATADEPKRKWLAEVVDHLAEARRRRAASPKLADEIDLDATWAEAVRTANRKLRLYEDPEFPGDAPCPFTLNALLSDRFDPEAALGDLQHDG